MSKATAQNAERRNAGNTRVREHDIEPAFVSFDLSKEAVQVAEFRNISLDCGYVRPYRPYRLRQLPATTAPVMKTYAPSSTNSLAVASPIPLLPPVTGRSILPACPLVSLSRFRCSPVVLTF